MPEPIIWLRAEMPLFSSLLQAVLSLILALGVTSLSAGTAGAIEAAVAAVGALIVAIWTTPSRCLRSPVHSRQWPSFWWPSESTVSSQAS